MSDMVSNEFNRFYDYAYKAWSAYYSEANKDLRSYAGDNWTQNERKKLAAEGRHALELNKQRRTINLFSGVWRENLKTTVASPQSAEDQVAADQISDALIWQYQKANVYNMFNSAFDHHLTGGMSLAGISMSLENDQVFGDIQSWWRPYNAVMLDPYFTKRDLSDCDQASTRDLLSKGKVKSLLPFIDDEVIDGLSTGIRDNKYEYMGAYRDVNASTVYSPLVTYDQYWRRITRDCKYLINMSNGEQQEIDESKVSIDELRATLDQENAAYLGEKKFVIRDGRKSSVELNILVGGECLYSGPDPTGLDNYPFVLLIPFFEPLIDSYQLKIQGLIRSTRDAQVLYNKRNSQIIDIMESKINSGYMMNYGAVLDEGMLLQSGQSKVVVTEEGRTIDEIREIVPPDLPASYLQYGQMLDRDILEIPGGSEEMMGLSSAGDSQVSGALAMVRASNGLRANRQIYDNAEQAMLSLGNKIFKTMQKNYGEGKWERILGEPPVEQIKNSDFDKFDIVMKQSPLTTTQRDAYYSELINLFKMGAPIPWSEILKESPIQGKRNLLKIVENLEAKAEAEQKIQEEERQEIQNLAKAREQLEVSRAQASIADAQSKTSLNEERLAAAQLDRAKAVKELTEADLTRIEKVLELMETLKSMETPDGREDERNEGL